MTPHYTDDHVELYHGDCLDVMRQLPDASVDAVVTDPPYGLEFMGKEWDRPWAVSPTQGVGFSGREGNLTLPSFGDNRNANCRACGGRQRGKKRCTCDVPEWDRKPGTDMAEFQSWCLTWTTELYRVLKPGGHLLAFGGTRTWHRLACAIEDAGFEVRDCIAWMYGSGFPKSLNVAIAIDKAAGVMSHRGVRVSVAGNRAQGQDLPHASSVDAHDPITPAAQQWQGWGTALKPAFEPVVVARKPLVGTVAANVEQYGTGALNIDGARIGFASDADEAESKGKNRHADFGTESGGNEVYGDYSMVPRSNYNPPGRWPANVILDESQAEALDRQSGVSKSVQSVRLRAGAVIGNGETHGTFIASEDNVGGFNDEGGASRFFYTAKADSSERPRVNGVAHPTVKPLDLMRYLVRLVTPPGGVVLEPFAGSGTTLEACIVEGFRCIGIEREADYIPLIMQRITKPIEVTLL